MIRNKKFLQVVNILEYVALITATVAVLISQFLPYLQCIITGLVAYVVGFLIASFRAVLNCIEVFTASKRVVDENSALVTSSSVEVLNSKKERTHAVLSVVLWVALLVFALVVLILYPKTV